MQNGYYQVTGAMVTQFNRLDVITHNLANVNTIGYKKDDVVIADFERIFQDKRDILPLEDNTRAGSKFLNRTINRVPNIDDVYTNFTAGGLKATGNTLDLAITRDDAFLLVKTPTGIRLTKNGALSLDDEGFLVTKEGFKVLPSGYETMAANRQGISIPQNASLKIDKDGNVYSDNNPIAKLYIAQPKELRNLKKENDNVYILPKLEEMTDLANSGAIAQGFIQMSNVNAVIEMANLIQTNRLVEMYQKTMTSHMNDFNEQAINKLASLRA